MTHFAHTIHGDGASLEESFDALDLCGKLATYGVVVLRGFRDGVSSFERVTDRLGTVRPANIRVDTVRRFESANGTQAVNAGNGHVPMHAESYYTPISPQILAFVCLTNTAVGGETLLCDGAELFERLPATDQAALHSSEIIWRHECTIEELEAQTQTPLAEFLGWCARSTGTEVSVDEQAGRLRILHVAPAIRRTWWHDRPAFANNLIPIQEAGVLDSMAPGLAANVVQSAGVLARELTIAHSWEPEDLVLVDNTRCLHGRNAWSGGNRHLRVRMLTVENS